MCFAYCAVLLITAHAYQRNLRRAMVESMINEQLVIELSSANRKLEELAYNDPLTGLTNRRLFQDQAEEALERCKRHNTHLALILIDLDNFKEINDTLGHPAGDQMLIAIAQRLKSALRLTDPISHLQVGTARFGGDEFIVLLEDIRSSDDIDSAARRILGEIRQPLHLDAHRVSPTCSMGIAIFPHNGDTIPTLIRRADIALYRVKEGGRNGYQFHDT
jgi:diguanylate cyclase (GGDEF)-like protein